AAVAFVDQPAAPLHHGVAGGDQPGQTAQTALHQLAADDRRAVGFAILGPGDHAGHHHPHHAGGVGAQRDAAQIQAVVGNRQAVTLLGNQQVLRRHAQVLEDDALVVGVLERPQAVLPKLEVLVLLIGQIDNQHRRTLVDQAHQAHGATGNDVGDEQFFAVDD